MEAVREAIEEKLDECHDLIAEIEADLSLDLLPVGTPLRGRYVEALELRSTGQDLLRGATTRRELTMAENRIDRALRDLRLVRDHTALPRETRS